MSVRQGATAWNGSSWVQIATPTSHGAHSTYTYQQRNQGSMPSYFGSQTQTVIHSRPPVSASGMHQQAPSAGGTPPIAGTPAEQVEYYSRYYQYWIQQGNLKKKEVALLPPGPLKDEASRAVAWADYYATQSAHAAHYYNNQINANKPSQMVSSGKTQASHQTSVLPASAPATISSPAKIPQSQNIIDKYETNKKSNSSSPSHVSNSSPSQKLESKMKKNENLDFLKSSEGRRNSKRMELYSSKLKPTGRSPISDEEKDTKQAPENNAQESVFVMNSPKASLQNLSNTKILHEKKDSLHAEPTKVKNENSSKKTKQSSFNNSRKRSRVSEKLITEEEYMCKMPENDSYYGRSISPNKESVKSASSGLSSPEKVKKSKEGSSNTFKKQKISPAIIVSSEAKNAIAKTSKQFVSKKVNAGFESSKKILAKRANRFSGKGGLSNSSNDFTADVAPTTKLGQYMGLSVIGGGGKKVMNKFNKSSTGNTEKQYEKMTVKGLCQRLEKDFFRLTAPPQAEMVRPQPILQQHVRNLKKKWSSKETDYSWLCSQLKAVRQDLTVQRINNQFAVEVYETHARVAIEQGDINEYNQCQTQLMDLYDILEKKNCEKILQGNTNIPGLLNQNEFIAYRLIYYVFLTGNKKYDGGSSDLFNIMLSLTPSQKKDPCIVHALKVRAAVAESDYHAFFRLLDDCPKMGAYLMDNMVPSMRFSALKTICAAYRPSISVKFVLTDLGFDVEDDEEFKLGLKWIQSCGGKVDDNLSRLLTKESFIRNPSTKEQNSLI